MPGVLPLLAVSLAAPERLPVELDRLFLLFLKFGAVVYGSGYVLFAFLRGDLVERLGWLTEGQLVDALAVGQLTPGPVFTAATFIGYLLGGLVARSSQRWGSSSPGSPSWPACGAWSAGCDARCGPETSWTG